MEYNIQESLDRIYGAERAREILEAYQGLDQYKRGSESPLRALVDSRFYRKGTLPQERFEDLVNQRGVRSRGVNVVVSLREYAQRVKANAARGVEVSVTPEDIAAVLAYDYPVFDSRAKAPIIGKGIRRVYTGQTECAGSAPM